jgi:hypothetical protein
MNRTMRLLLTSLFLLFLTGFKPKAPEAYYALLIVDGTFANKVGYVSRVIYYPGYQSCNKTSSSYFFNDAKQNFNNHLKAYYSKAFPTGAGNNVSIIDTKKFSTSTVLETSQQAQTRLTEWIAEQKEQGYEVMETSFNYTCK